MEGLPPSSDCAHVASGGEGFLDTWATDRLVISFSIFGVCYEERSWLKDFEELIKLNCVVEDRNNKAE